MKRLFRLATNRFTLECSRVQAQDPPVLAMATPTRGRFKLTIRNQSLTRTEPIFRDGTPDSIASDYAVDDGPPLFEESRYQLYAKATGAGDRIEVRNRDPSLVDSLGHQEHGQVHHGTINFRGHVGRSLFTVYVNDVPEIDFEVEVFPTKVDYESDYREILGDVQEILTTLAYEYLRSTYQLGKRDPGKRPSRMEWLVLIGFIMDDLEAAMNQIARHPTRGLVRRPRSTRLERVRRVDSQVRAQLRRGIGQGGFVRIASGIAREQIVTRPAELTLDTMEHRWLKKQLTGAVQTLNQIASDYLAKENAGPRKQETIRGVRRFQERLSRMLDSEPMREAEGVPPTGFASLQLVSAPGYREAYQKLMFLRMSLRLEGELVRLSVKELPLLYEYWTYLTVVRMIADEYGWPDKLSELFKIQANVLSVSLTQGKQQAISFRAGHGRKITVFYNRTFRDRDLMLMTQRPDILIQLKEGGWPKVQLVCDAKYRIDASDEYRQQYGSFGPPADAINVLHRYRDAILESEPDLTSRNQRKRSVVQAAALFPMNSQSSQDFRDSRLWTFIDRVGIGAIPVLPSNTALLQEWLLTVLREGGWSLADRAIASSADRQATDWRFKANRPVLVGVLRSPGTLEHLNWIHSERLYFVPFAPTQRRQLQATQVAIYLPNSLDEPSGIRYIAHVEQIDVCDRHEISTPWVPRRTGQMVLYRLSELLPMPRNIKIQPDEHTAIRTSRWTSELGIERAKTLSEIALETEPEWRLLEWLRAHRLSYRLKPHAHRSTDLDNPRGRVWFELDGERVVRYDGANNFLVRSSNLTDRFISLRELEEGELLR